MGAYFTSIASTRDARQNTASFYPPLSMNNNPLPTPSDASPRAGAPQKNRVKKRVLWGCGCGCLLPLFLVIALVAWGSHYVKSPGEQIPTRRLLSESSEGLILLSPKNGRQAMGVWTGELLAELGRLDPEDFEDPDLKEMVQSLQGFRAESVAEFFDFMPSSFTVALGIDSAKAGQLTAISGLNLEFGGKASHFLFDYFLTDDSSTIEHAGASIVPFTAPSNSKSNWYIAFAKDTPIFGNNLPLLKSTLTELLDPEVNAEQPSPALLRMQGDWAELSSNVLLGATLGYRERMSAELVRTWFDGLAEMIGRDFERNVDPWPNVGLDHLRLEMQPDGDDATARLELFGVAPDDMPACEAFVDEWMATIQTQLRSEGLDVAIDRLSGPGNLVLDLRLNDFKTWLITRVVDNVEAQSSRSTSTQDL